jgi:cbb3-type cytochrome oxidase maturation protein
MSALFVLIAISLALSFLFVGVCIISIRNGQFDDLESPKWRVLFADIKETLPTFETITQKPNQKTESLARMDHDDSY